jgi:tetratricopeptide (TPR) repeat protein
VKLFNNITVSRYLPGKALLLLLVGALLLNACATQQTVTIDVPPLQNHVHAERVADVDVLEMTPEMDAFLERYVLEYSDAQTRLHLLMTAISSSGVKGFNYDEGMTLTAKEAFETGAGNCIAYANMMIALARKSGIKANYQEVFRRPEWSNHEDTVLLIKHINVVLSIPGYSYVIDISGAKINENTRQRIISDRYAEALYWNNIGAEALLSNELPTAHAYMSKALQTEPQLTDAWVNLGVVLGRNEQLQDAEFSLLQALEINGGEYAAMSNLYEVYLAQEDMQSAMDIQLKVEKYRRKNPYYLLRLSDEALAEARFDESISLLQNAIRKKKDDHELHFALAKTQYLSGAIVAAEGSLVRARELAPQNMLAYYDQPLEQLVAKE